MKPVPIPVVTFHSIRPIDPSWPWNFLSCPPELFEYYLKYLKSHGYTSVLLSDVWDYNLGKKSLPKKTVALAFDDGYLDCWTIAAPLLKKYGFCGTVFVNPSFVDPSAGVRRQVGKSEWENIPGDLVDGFMSWDELRAAQQDGVLDVQSHGVTHTWYPQSEEIIDFHHPGDCYPWLAWNAKPERKHLWIAEDQSGFVGYGAPIYKHEKSLIVRRYFEPEELTNALVEYVNANGGADFFEKPDWKEILMAEAARSDAKGRYETEDEYKARVLWELKTSREEIESKMGKPIQFMCWPGGGYNDITVESAAKAGYLGWNERGGPSKDGLPNIPGKSVLGIGRMSVPIVNVGVLSNLVNHFIFIYKLQSSREVAGWKQARAIIKKLNVVQRLMKS